MPRRSNKFGATDPKVIAGGLCCCCIVISIIISIIGAFSKKKPVEEAPVEEAPASASASASAPAASAPAASAPASAPPSGKRVDGWYGNYGASGIFDTYSENPHVDYTADSCAAEAKKRGADIFTLRKSNHPAKGYESTCIGFNSTPDIINFKGDLLSPGEHITGCSDPSKSWPNCK